MSNAVAWHNGVLSPEFLQRVGFGFEPKYRLVERVSTKPDVTNSPEHIWDLPGNITLPSTSGPMSIVSTSADDAPGGTGLRSVVCETLDPNGELLFQVVALNGTTPVIAPTNCLRCNWSIGHESGSNRANVGAITGSIGGNTQWHMLAGFAKTHGYFYTVPAGRQALIFDSTFIWGLTTDLVLQCVVGVGPGAQTLATVLSTSFDSNSSGNTLRPLVPMGELSDTFCTVQRGSGNGGRFGFIGLFLEYNPAGR